MSKRIKLQESNCEAWYDEEEEVFILENITQDIYGVQSIHYLFLAEEELISLLNSKKT